MAHKHIMKTIIFLVVAALFLLQNIECSSISYLDVTNNLFFGAVNKSVVSNAFTDRYFSFNVNDTKYTNGGAFPLMTFKSGYPVFKISLYTNDYYYTVPVNYNKFIVPFNINSSTGNLSLEASFNHLQQVPYTYSTR